MDTERITDIFDSIYETEALIVKPAKGEEIQRCNEDLAELGFGFIPPDYIEFLEVADGVAWNGFEFFGVFRVTVKKSGYVLPDLISMNQKIREDKFGMDNRLYLGRFDDDIYVYDRSEDMYLTLDNLTLTLIDSFETFEDMFVSSITPYIDYDEDDEYDYDDEDASLDEGE
ncbi:MAG: YrhA family protein [Lachnospiraceae bacterium]|nr:YrhA family protein [Lachnospiraceae bacterium]